MVHGVGFSGALPLMPPSLHKPQSGPEVHRQNDGHAHGPSIGPGKPEPSREANGSRATGNNAESGVGGSARALSESEQQQVAELKARDRHVKAHEMAHKAAAGRYGGPVSYEYQAGPDGRRYAVGGEVAIDSSEIPGDPDATIRKMQIIARAALAPAQPSAQDRSVAAQAQQSAANARRELFNERMNKSETGSSETESTGQPVGQAIDTTV